MGDLPGACSDHLGPVHPGQSRKPFHVAGEVPGPQEKELDIGHVKQGELKAVVPEPGAEARQAGRATEVTDQGMSRSPCWSVRTAW